MSNNELKAESINVIGEMTSLIKLDLSGCALSEVPQRYVKRATRNRYFVLLVS